LLLSVGAAGGCRCDSLSQPVAAGHGHVSERPLFRKSCDLLSFFFGERLPRQSFVHLPGELSIGNLGGRDSRTGRSRSQPEPLRFVASGRIGCNQFWWWAPWGMGPPNFFSCGDSLLWEARLWLNFFQKLGPGRLRGGHVRTVRWLLGFGKLSNFQNLLLSRGSPVSQR